MSIHKKALISLFVVLFLVVAATFLTPCEDGFFMGYCEIGRLLTIPLVLAFYIIFAIVSSLVYKIFLKKMKILKWQNYMVIYAVSFALILLAIFGLGFLQYLSTFILFIRSGP